MSTNPDFRFTPDRTTLEPQLAEAFTERDRQLEDFLNRHVVRRVRAASVLGDGTSHTTTAYTNVGPALTLSFGKAAPRSNLVVQVDAHGEITFAAAACWVTFGVAVSVDGTGLGDSDVCSADLGGTGYLHVSGATELVGVGRGAVVLTLRIKNNAGTTAFTTRTHSTLSITCTEVHAP